MRNRRREFIKLTGVTGIGIAGGLFNGFASDVEITTNTTNNTVKKTAQNEAAVSVIGAYGAWAAGLTETRLPALSFRKKEYTNLQTWKKLARQKEIGRASCRERV